MKPRVLLARSGEATKTSGEAARNRLPGWLAFFIAAPITYFDNPMTGLVNCNKKFSAIKTNYPMRCLLDCREVCERRESGEMWTIIVDFVVVRSRSNSENLSISMQNLINVSKCEEYHNCTLSEIWNWSSNRKIGHIIWSCVPCLCTKNRTS